MLDFDALSHVTMSRTALCGGDLMLDEFGYGEVMLMDILLGFSVTSLVNRARGGRR